MPVASARRLFVARLHPPWSVGLIGAFPARRLQPLCMGAPSRARAHPRRWLLPEGLVAGRDVRRGCSEAFFLPGPRLRSTRRGATRGVRRRAGALRHCAAPCHGPGPFKRGLKCRTTGSTYNAGGGAGAAVPTSFRHQGPRRPGPRRPAPDNPGIVVTALPIPLASEPLGAMCPASSQGALAVLLQPRARQFPPSLLRPPPSLPLAPVARVYPRAYPSPITLANISYRGLPSKS